MEFLNTLTKWAVVSRDDSTLIVDTAEVEFQYEQYHNSLNDLLSTPPVLENHDALSTKVARLLVAAQSLKAVCDDLEGPLDKLLTTICDFDDDETTQDR